MDVNDFQTIGECDLGYTWKVASENKIVVNIGKVALYFEVDEFFVFGKMIEDSVQNLSKDVKKTKAPVTTAPESKISNIAKFRVSKDDDE